MPCACLSTDDQPKEDQPKNNRIKRTVNQKMSQYEELKRFAVWGRSTTFPFSFTFWRARLVTFSTKSAFDTPLNSQSTTRTPSIGARVKPRYKAYCAFRVFKLRISRFRATGTNFPASPSS